MTAAVEPRAVRHALTISVSPELVNVIGQRRSRCPTEMPILWALANPKLDEREVLSAMLNREPHPATDRPSLLVIADKGFASKEFEADLAFRGAELLRPSFKREKKRRGQSLLKSVRQLLESVNDTLKASSTWNSTVAGPSKVSPSASPNASSRWPPRSGTTTRPAGPSYDP
ncbi:hypothetical protein ABT126_40685 [Streptomyces sp. NPDC002012]|uniref:hypothetical protein n=1 Tax=Streptomyces sp. NPDC002012 TaxID=3154532 RepID=UPI00332D18C2